MKIEKFTTKYLGEMARLFSEVYSEPGEKWSIEASSNYLKNEYRLSPKLCFVALDDEGKCVGGIFAKTFPSPKGKFVSIDSIQVQPRFRKMGVAKELLKKLVAVSKRDKVEGFYLLADSRKEFPRSWFMYLGFEPDHWLGYTAARDKIKL